MPPKTQVDSFFRGQAYGTVASRLAANNFNVNSLRTNSVLRNDEWKDIDDVVLKIAQERLVGVKDLMRMGLTRTIPNGLGKTVLEYEDVSGMEAAQLSMAGVTKGRNDRVEYSLKAIPLPLIHVDFQLNIRALEASRNRGESLDTTQAELASRNVAEKAEEILFTGASSFTYGGGTLYGYMDQPNRNTVTLATNWDASAATGTTILNDVLAMKQASIGAKHYGPWMLYIPTAYETVLDDEFKSNSDRSVRERIMAIQGITGISVVDKLTANNVLLVQMTSDVVRLIEGLNITTVEWDEQGGMIHQFKVMAIWVPQIRADQDGNSGLTHLA